jgi:extradiol dioxygenase family protein
MQPFHLAFPVTNIEETHLFYTNVLGAKVGRSDTRWIDFDFWGHQISAHLVDQMHEEPQNRVDGKQVPTRHFGVILDWNNWHKLAERLKSQTIDFLIEPYIRFEGLPGEQATMFFFDPSGNALEFKAFRDRDTTFAHQ